MKLKNLLIRLSVLAALLLAPLALSSAVSAHHCVGGGGVDHGAAGASIAECLDAGACLDTTGAGCSAQLNAKKSVSDILRVVLNVLSIVAGVAAVIMIIIGGLKYIMSSGDSGNVSGAKNTILYAIIGLVVVVLAQVVVKFVIDKARTNTTPATPSQQVAPAP